MCSFPVRWKKKGETETVCVFGLPVVPLTGHEIGQQAPFSQIPGLRHSFLLTKEEDRQN